MGCAANNTPLQGYIYVEAAKESHVKDAIKGLRTVFSGKGVRLVPINEMVDAVTVNKKAKDAIGECSSAHHVAQTAGLLTWHAAQMIDACYAMHRGLHERGPSRILTDLHACGAC